MSPQLTTMLSASNRLYGHHDHHLVRGSSYMVSGPRERTHVAVEGTIRSWKTLYTYPVYTYMYKCSELVMMMMMIFMIE